VHTFSQPAASFFFRKESNKPPRKKKPLRDPFILGVHFEPFRQFVLGTTRYRRKGNLLVAVFLMAATGLRINEVRLLSIGQVAELADTGRLRVSNVKRIGTRDVVLISLWRSQLRALLPLLEIRSPLLLPSSSDPSKPLQRERFVRIASDLLNRFKLTLRQPHLVFSSHSFRIGFITELKRRGFTLDQIRHIVGHRNIATTALYDRYGLPADEQLALLEKAFGPREKDPKKNTPHP
jgi:integrase